MLAAYMLTLRLLLSSANHANPLDRQGNAQYFCWMRQAAEKGRVNEQKGVCALKMSVKILIVCSIIANCALEETPGTLRHRLLIF